MAVMCCLVLREFSHSVFVPLPMVKSEWEAHGGCGQLQMAGLHYAIYRDVVGSVFRPRGFLKAVYKGERAVERGNVITPTEVRTGEREGYWVHLTVFV